MKLVSNVWIVVSFQDQKGEPRFHPWLRNVTESFPEPLWIFRYSSRFIFGTESAENFLMCNSFTKIPWTASYELPVTSVYTPDYHFSICQYSFEFFTFSAGRNGRPSRCASSVDILASSLAYNMEKESCQCLQQVVVYVYGRHFFKQRYLMTDLISFFPILGSSQHLSQCWVFGASSIVAIM